MFITATNQSFVAMPAAEVLRLAEASIKEIEDIRRRALKSALEFNERQRTRGLLFVRSKYKNQDDALENSPEVQLAKRAANKDMETCKLMKKVATYLLNSNLPPEQQIINVTLSDFRALT